MQGSRCMNRCSRLSGQRLRFMIEGSERRVKPRLRVTCDAEDPFFIDRVVIWQGCDWPKSGGVLRGTGRRGLRVGLRVHERTFQHIFLPKLSVGFSPLWSRF